MIVVQLTKSDFKTRNMKIRILQTQSRTRFRTASFGFTLVETMVAIMVAAIMLSAHFLAFASGFAMVTVTREDLRASQIMLQRMEAIRVAGFSQLNDTTKFPTNSFEYYDEKHKTNGNGGVRYTVTYSTKAGYQLVDTTMPTSYRTNLTEVTVGVSWNSGTTTRSRSMRTYVTRYGVESYVAGSR